MTTLPWVRDPTLRTWARLALAQGWEVAYTGAGHLRWRSPAGHLVFTPSTPSAGSRALLNTRASLRRHGLAVP